MKHSKEKILESYSKSIRFVNKYVTVRNEVIRQPIAHGKWSIIEIIGHLIAWDEMILKDRLPYIMNNKSLSSLPSVEIVNEQAATWTLSKPSFEVFEKFILIRTKLIKQIELLNEEIWTREFSINNSTYTFESYFKGLIQHDEHHFQQCNDFLKGVL